jgi:hypothetical protein
VSCWTSAMGVSSIDAEYTRAVELSTGERPSDANPLWIDLDRRLTDAAAFVPIWNENFYVLPAAESAT